jgi:hypothetical protein
VTSGTLADLASRVPTNHRSDPALVIVGDVVALRERIRWFEPVPLRGERTDASDYQIPKARNS